MPRLGRFSHERVGDSPNFTRHAVCHRSEFRSQRLESSRCCPLRLAARQFRPHSLSVRPTHARTHARTLASDVRSRRAVRTSRCARSHTCTLSHTHALTHARSLSHTHARSGAVHPRRAAHRQSVADAASPAPAKHKNERSFYTNRQSDNESRTRIGRDQTRPTAWADAWARWDRALANRVDGRRKAGHARSDYDHVLDVIRADGTDVGRGRKAPARMCIWWPRRSPWAVSVVVEIDIQPER